MNAAPLYRPLALTILDELAAIIAEREAIVSGLLDGSIEAANPPLAVQFRQIGFESELYAGLVDRAFAARGAR